MKRIALVLTAAIGLGAIGCEDDPNALTGARTTPDDEPTGDTSDGLTCVDAPAGRSYATFDGSKLEGARRNENVGIDRARVKPFASLEKEFQRVLGVAPASLAGAESSFDVPAVRWFGESKLSAVSLHAMATIAFEGCLAYAKGKPALAAAPTKDSADVECSSLMRKAWSRSPTPEEVGHCSKLATTAKPDEAVARRWAYACTSVMSSAHFLTF